MTDENDTREELGYLDLTMGFDPTGDPLLQMYAHFPEGAQVPLDVAEGLAMHILAAVHTARAYSTVARKMMLDGMPGQQVAHFLRDVMNQ